MGIIFYACIFFLLYLLFPMGPDRIGVVLHLVSAFIFTFPILQVFITYRITYSESEITREVNFVFSKSEKKYLWKRLKFIRSVGLHSSYLIPFTIPFKYSPIKQFQFCFKEDRNENRSYLWKWMSYNLLTNTMMTNNLEVLKFVDNKFSDRYFDEGIKAYYLKKNK